MVVKKIMIKMYVLGRSLYLLRNIKPTLFKLFIYPHFEYCSTLFMVNINYPTLHKTYIKAIDRFFKIKILTPFDIPAQINTLKIVNIAPLVMRLFNNYCALVHNIMTTDVDGIVRNKIVSNIRINLDSGSQMVLRNAYRDVVFKTKYMLHSFTFLSVKLLNGFICNHLIDTKQQFKTYLEKQDDFLYQKYVTFMNLNVNTH
jgi:hypothetical protein